MSNVANVDVTFYDQACASVFYESNVPDHQDGTMRIAHFCYYTARTISNLKGHESANSIQGDLLWNAYGTLVEMWDESFDGLRLVPFTQRGKYTFNSTLTCGESSPRLTYKTHGFGFLARGVAYYAPMSVLALMISAMRSMPQDWTFKVALGLACSEMARAEITIANANAVAYQSFERGLEYIAKEAEKKFSAENPDARDKS